MQPRSGTCEAWLTWSSCGPLPPLLRLRKTVSERCPRIPLEQNGRQVCASRFVVKTHGHQRQRLDNTQPILKAPAKQYRVPRRDKNPRPLQFAGGGNQCLQVFCVLAHCVAEEAKCRSIGAHMPSRLGD